MMNTNKIAIALAVLACSSGSVLAQESIDVQVKGTITPGACSIALTGSGVIDYGIIKAKDLKRDEITPLDKRQLNINVKCDGLTHVYLKPTDQRSTSVKGIDTTKIDKSFGDGVAGLGLTGSKSIGVYTMALTDIKSDAGNKPVKATNPSAGEWSWGGASTPFYKSSENLPVLISVGDAASSDQWSPSALSTLSATINVQAHINKASELDLTKEIPLNGLTTIDLVYL